MTLKLCHKYILKNQTEIYISYARHVTIDTNLRIFQYKLLNNVLYLNEKLFKFNIVFSPLCSFCNSEDETPIHLFHPCNQTKSHWSKLQELLNSKVFIPQNTPQRKHSLVFQTIKKILKSLTICILYLNIICLSTGIQKKKKK